MSDDTPSDNEGDTATADDESSSSSSMTGALPDADDMSQEELDEIDAEVGPFPDPADEVG